MQILLFFFCLGEMFNTPMFHVRGYVHRLGFIHERSLVIRAESIQIEFIDTFLNEHILKC